MTIVILILSTAFLVLWLCLLFMTTSEDWIAAAYNEVLDIQAGVQRLRERDAARAKRISEYHGTLKYVMQFFWRGDSSKEIAKLEARSEALQDGDLKTVGIIDIPGYVVQRRFEQIGKSALHKKIFQKCVELYGKKYAEKKSSRLLARLISYPLLGVSLSLAIGTLFYSLNAQSVGLCVIVIGTLLVIVLTYAQYDEIGDTINKRRASIARQFPNVVSKLALLVTSGMIISKAWKETAWSQDGELYREMRQTAEELDNLVNPAQAYTNFINRCNTKETTKLASAIIQSQSKGNAEIGKLLKDMAHEAWQERRHTAKRDSEKANSKLMIPTMMLFIAILIMIMVPIAINFSAL